MQEKEKENYVILFFICIIAIYHYSVVNDIEKIFFSSVLPRDITKRPLKKCLYRQRKRQCQGFPSGHTEAATLALVAREKRFPPSVRRLLGYSHGWVTTHFNAASYLVAGFSWSGARYNLLFCLLLNRKTSI